MWNKLKSLLIEAFKANFDLIAKWFAANGLKLNVQKTQILNFHANYSKSSFADKDYPFKVESACSFLGLKIDSSLTWKNHVEHLVGKISKAYYAILTLSGIVDYSVLKQVYYAYVYSYITYGVIFWGDSSLSYKVFRKQKEIVRVMMGAKRRASCRPLFLESGILPLPCVFILYSLLYVKSNFEEFSSRNHVHNYGLKYKRFMIKLVLRTCF